MKCNAPELATFIVAEFASSANAVDYSVTWVGNSFSGAIDKWMQNFFIHTAVIPDGTFQSRGMKHQAPPLLVYALSLFAHCRMDGAYCWETGTMYSEDVADAGKLGEGGMQIPIRKTVEGMTKDVVYYIKYFGFYNYQVLGMWQASQHKDIIEADTEWLVPEFRTSTCQVWRSGDERYPSYCNYYKEPLVRAKPSIDGSEWLVIACNPHNRGVQQVRLRGPDQSTLIEFQLIGDYPVIKRFRIKS